MDSLTHLVWFNRGFMRAEIREGQLQLADLRMGVEPDYAFRFGVAERQQDGWRAIPPVDVERDNTMEAVRRYWQRWRNRDQNLPAAQAAAETSGTTPATNASK